jgi:hypothetical protein
VNLKDIEGEFSRNLRDLELFLIFLKDFECLSDFLKQLGRLASSKVSGENKEVFTICPDKIPFKVYHESIHVFYNLCIFKEP